ncbi:hypothetical protein [Mesorhizobium sp. YM1C-6-2]|uniref:hypothetical protein n=1 Tax=Mesorhizobium sp. YM1C-6-2 TaxID=1827501 RepID=UPI000EF282EA|nr:hypothetical protein [Mesorhizobium sp. YM1C-6-2]RLP25566.1 hypothetical protein D8676_13540 [Mesorhizobium sp. YM1C-6-2]
MKAVLIALALLLVPFEAQAISRYNSTSMSCGQIKATVRAEGAVILRWRGRSGVQRYGRFVAHDGFCESGTRAETSYVPARDRKSCSVYECKYWDPDDDIIFRFGRRD